MIMRVLITAFLLPTASLAQGLEERADRFAQDFISEIHNTSEAGCREELAVRQARYIAMVESDIKPLELIVEGHRLFCESLRIDAEITRLDNEKVRLNGEIARLDAKWVSTGAPEYLGRDRSQRIMRADARGIDSTMQRLVVVSNDLQSEALRILALSVLDTPRQSLANKVVMLAAMDAEGQRSILDTFRDLLPKLS